MKKISILGVLIGGVTDIVSTNILAMPLLVYVLITRVHLASGMSSTEITARLTNALQNDTGIFLAQLAIGSLCSIFAGYVAAWIAKHNQLLNGALSAWLCFSIGIYGVVTKIDSSPLLVTVLGFALSPALGLLGGYLRLLRVQAKQAKAVLAGAV